jgi:outer membrane lipoprotein LolB
VRRVRAWLAAVGVVALAACTTTPPPPPAGDTLSGRLAVKVDAAGTQPARSVSAGFDLTGTGDAGRLELTSPLGTVVARADWTPGQATLVTSDGESRFGNLDALTQEMLGETLPVAALFDWLRGRPWPGAPATPTAPPAEPGFDQLGWAVRLGRFEEGWVTATRARAPQVTVRAQVQP